MNILDKDSGLTYQQARDYLDYDKNSGVFKWAVSRGNVAAGRVAGTRHTNGYLTAHLNGKQYFLHRIAWLFEYGDWPKNFIDHINGNKTDNRLLNLRDVSYSENNQNLHRAKSSNKSGLLGVSWHKKSKKWQASIRVDGKCVFLGYFKDPKEAHAVYLCMREKSPQPLQLGGKTGGELSGN